MSKYISNRLKSKKFKLNKAIILFNMLLVAINDDAVLSQLLTTVRSVEQIDTKVKTDVEENNASN
jgi:hypothetical protein